MKANILLDWSFKLLEVKLVLEVFLLQLLGRNTNRPRIDWKEGSFSNEVFLAYFLGRVSTYHMMAQVMILKEARELGPPYVRRASLKQAHHGRREFLSQSAIVFMGIKNDVGFSWLLPEIRTKGREEMNSFTLSRVIFP